MTLGSGLVTIHVVQPGRLPVPKKKVLNESEASLRKDLEQVEHLMLSKFYDTPEN